MDDSAAADHPDVAHPVFIIAGPTCSGKSGLALEIAREFNAEIISADSRQIYRQLKIGTARLEPDQWQGVPHHLMGSIDLGERFTAFDFVREARKIITTLHESGKEALICGGTGLYLRALTEGIFEIPDDDLSYREELIDLATRKGPGHIYRMLEEVDPEEARKIHPQNQPRVIRALEIHHITGKTKTELMKSETQRPLPYHWEQILLLPDRSLLYEKIDRRVDKMIEKGLVREAQNVFNSSFGNALRQARVVGYQELVDCFEGRLDLAEAIELIKRNTRRFAKRQYTWFRAVSGANRLSGFGVQNKGDCRRLVKAAIGSFRAS
jgi:tRNA dimethylallyltransferase